MDNFPRLVDFDSLEDVGFCSAIFDLHGLGSGTYDYDWDSVDSEIRGWDGVEGKFLLRSARVLCGGMVYRCPFNSRRIIGRLDLVRWVSGVGARESEECFAFFEKLCREYGATVIEFHLDAGLGRLEVRDRWMRLRQFKEGFRVYVKELD